MTAGSKTGKWLRAGCFAPWTLKNSGHMRLIVIGFAHKQLGFAPGYQFAYVGNTDITIDNKIDFLKTATMLSG